MGFLKPNIRIQCKKQQKCTMWLVFPWEQVFSTPWYCLSMSEISMKGMLNSKQPINLTYSSSFFHKQHIQYAIHNMQRILLVLLIQNANKVFYPERKINKNELNAEWYQ